MGAIVQKLIGMFLTKKKIIAYVSAVIIAAVAAFFGMSSQEVKEAIVSGPSIQAPAGLIPAPAVTPEKK